MRVLVTGATGFTGGHVVPLLHERGVQVRCFVRPSSTTTALPVGVELAHGDLADQDSLTAALQGVDALVNIASLGFGHAPNIVGAALAAGVRRAIFISTTAIFTSLNAPSKSVRLAAEATVRDSGLAYTILRPTMIYGTSRDRNMCRLVRFIQRSPIIPIAGSGKCLQQPVYVADVAAAVVQALGAEQAAGKAYNISGAEPLTYNQVVDTVAKLSGRRVCKLHLPARPLVRVLSVLERLSLPSPIKAEQILRLNEDKAFDSDAAARDFGYQPMPFHEGIRLELEEMGLVPRKTG